MNQILRKHFMIVKNNTRNINYFANLRHSGNHVKNQEEKQMQKQILQEHLGFSYQKSCIFLRTHAYLKTIDNQRFLDTIKLLKRMGISIEDIYEYPMSLTLHNNTVEHNMKYMQEAGFTHITAQILLKFRAVVKKPVNLLKAHGIIPDEINVPERLYSYLFPRQEVFPILQRFSEDNTIIQIHESIFKNYLVWRLETTTEEIERIFKIYDTFKYKSFDLISQMIQILTEDLKFNNKKLLQNGYLFQNGPDFLRQILNSFPTLAGVDIKTVLFKYPKIIAVPPENITQINKHMKDFNIPDEAIQKCFEIYTLNPNTILYRLQELLKVPEFEVLIQNPRVVHLILSQNKAKLRLEHLQKLNVKCASLNVLCASDTVFERYAQEGNDRTKGYDLIHFLSTELNISLTKVRKLLADNPHWCHVPLTAIQNTLNYLLGHQLPKSEIALMPTILLYPKQQVSDALREINNNRATRELNLNSRERLNLCMYFIEKKHHFTGNGVWDNTSLEPTANVN